MGGRDRHEKHRTATPLELLFDLTFVVAFGVAASEYAHAMAEAHLKTAFIGFGFASFAVCWAWINFSWFASAYDTDDWIYRITTMVQMIGVVILALGLAPMFKSLDQGEILDNGVMVLGYVVMRFAMVSQWLRAARQDPARRRVCLTYAVWISLAQVGWVVLIFLDLTITVAFALSILFVMIEMLGPYLAEKKDGGTPWHAHHIVERYALFTIIALGEGIVGTVAALSAVIGSIGWTLDVVMVGFAGVGLTFGMWWVYFMLPSGPVLHAKRHKSFVWGYGLMITITSIVATGGGLHVGAYYIEHKSKLGPVATVLTVAIPLSIFLFSIYAMHAYLVEEFDRFHNWLLFGTAAVIAIAIIAAIAGVSMPVCLLILTLAPVVTIVGYETRGHQHQAEALKKKVGVG